MLLIRIAQLLVLAAGVLLSLAIDWYPFSGNRFLVHWQYLPWALLATVAAIAASLLAWRKVKRPPGRHEQ